jgi:uncharacterized coiled-coil protein SlyX
MTRTVEQRLVELEERIAFIDDAVQSLDATIAAQDRLLLELRREIAGKCRRGRAERLGCGADQI